jgi:hypothetical protein
LVIYVVHVESVYGLLYLLNFILIINCARSILCSCLEISILKYFIMLFLWLLILIRSIVFKLKCKAEYHQDAPCLPEQACGKQYVPCCLGFLLVMSCSSVETLSTTDFNNILSACSLLYCILQTSHLMKDRGFFESQEMPQFIIYNKRKFCVKHKQVQSGQI